VGSSIRESLREFEEFGMGSEFEKEDGASDAFGEEACV
jgi:hypothetical protein